MFKRTPKIEDLKLANEIDSVLNSMATFGPDSPEYPTLIAHLKELNDMRNDKKRKGRVSPDTMVIVGGGLLQVLIIVMYEQKHVMKSMSTHFIMKPKTNIT